MSEVNWGQADPINQKSNYKWNKGEDIKFCHITWTVVGQYTGISSRALIFLKALQFMLNSAHFPERPEAHMKISLKQAEAV